MNGSAEHTAVESDNQILTLLLAAQRLQRAAIDLVTDQLYILKIEEINAIQALILCSVGDESMTAGNLMHKGHYSGANVSYNLNRLVQLGYLNKNPNEIDRREVIVSVTDKGRNVRTRLTQRIATFSLNHEMRFQFPELIKQIDPMCGELARFIRYTR